MRIRAPGNLLTVSYGQSVSPAKPIWRSAVPEARIGRKHTYRVIARMNSVSSLRYGVPSVLKTSWNQMAGSRSV